MRGTKQHHSWKVDDERHKRMEASSMQASSTIINNNNPTHFTHGKTHTGIYY
jgi:hypothetical protein